jgi:hypothetical protein
MNSSLSSRVQGGMEYRSNQQPPTQKAAILKNLRVITGDTNLASDLNQVWVLREFQLSNREQVNSSNNLAEAYSLIITLPLANNRQVRPSNSGLFILDMQPEYQFQQNLTCMSQEYTTFIMSYRGLQYSLC